MDSLTTLLSEEITQRMGWVLVHFLWQGCVIMALAWCVFKAFGKASSNIRYLAACIGLGLMVAAPVLTFMAIGGGQGVVIAPEIAAVEAPVVENVRPSVPTQAVITSAEPAASESLRKILTARLEAALPYCVSGWIIGVAALSLWHLGGWTQLQRLRRQLVKQVTPALKAKLQQLSNALDIQKAIGLVESAMVQVPTVIGHLKPVILMPASALTGLSPEQIEAILAHELAHIKRCDYLVNILQTVVEILGFYHPAIWWVSHKIRIERENCCDDIAVSLCRDRICYAKALTTMEEIRASQPALAVAASGGSLFDRIRRLLGKDHANDARKSWLVPVAAILIMTFIFVSISCQRNQKSVPGSSWNSKIERLDIDKAGRNDVIEIFGEPTKYIWGMQQVFDKNALPARYVMVYPGKFHVFVMNDRVLEVRFEGPSDYVFGNGLVVGSSIEKAFSVLGQPAEVVDGKPNDFKDDVFYKNIDGKKGYGYYARPDKNIRIWIFDNKVKAIYLTRSNYHAGGGIKLKEAELPETSFIDKNGHIVDKVDYPFVNDPEVIGGWKSVDFVRDINDFDPDKKSWTGELYLNHLIFEEGGNIARNLFKWTKGLVLSDDTASKYTIKNIKDSQYLFYEWKSGDYTIRHQKPQYYVLKKESVESLKYEPSFGQKADIPPTSTINEKGHIVDKVDYPFVNDPEVIGGWKSVDFIRNINDFDPDKKNWRGELYLNHLIFEEGGNIAGNLFKWTKGLVLSKDTASKYIIKKIKDSQYLFYEWKSGDYTIRHMKPQYYVLKKDSAESLKNEPSFGEKADIPPTSTINEKGHIVDKIDYPFINDPEVIGTWKSVDFVKKIEQFQVGEQHRKGRGDKLLLHEMIFEKDGKLISKYDKATNGFPQTWTNGLILSNNIIKNNVVKTASKYIIKEINGSQYMFYEWKSGDYTFRHTKPAYYVLKKDSAESFKNESMYGKKADIPTTSTINEKNVRVYQVNRSVSDFPESEDFSTPENAYAAINRVMAADDYQGWQRVSVKRLSERLTNEGQTQEKKVDPEWAKVVLNARVLEVRISDDRAVVIAELPQKLTSKPIKDPIDSRYLQYEDGKWLNTGEDRFESLQRAYHKYDTIQQNESKTKQACKTALDNPDRFSRLAQELFEKLRKADYETVLSHYDEKSGRWRQDGWQKLDLYYTVHTDWPSFALWICKTFKDNPIKSVELDEVFFSDKENVPTVPYRLVLQDGGILEGDLYFAYRVESDNWQAAEGIDWHLQDNPIKYNSVATQTALEVLNIELEPVAQGKNVLFATVKNTSDKEQLFAIHIYTRSVDYGPQGIGWGTPFFEKLQPNETKRARFVYQIQGPFTENMYIRVKFYNPAMEKSYDYKKPFAERFYKGSDLQRREIQKALKPASDAQFREVSTTLKIVQDYIANKDYEKAWDVFAEDYKKAGYQARGFEAFKRQMEPKHRLDSAFTWEKSDFLKLAPVQAYDDNGTVQLQASCDGAVWTVDFTKENNVWKINWIAGYRPAILDMQETDVKIETPSSAGIAATSDTPPDPNQTLIAVEGRFILTDEATLKQAGIDVNKTLGTVTTLPADSNAITDLFKNNSLENITIEPSETKLLDNSQFKSLMEMIQKSNSRMLTSPKALVQNNESATLEVFTNTEFLGTDNQKKLFENCAQLTVCPKADDAGQNILIKGRILISDLLKPGNQPAASVPHAQVV